MDAAILTWFVSHRSAPLDVLALFFTFIGRAGLIFVAAAIVRGLLHKKLAMAAWQTVVAVLLTVGITNAIFKPLVDRARPFTPPGTIEVIGEEPANRSFPSTHASACVAGALLLASTWPRARVAIWGIVVLVAWSRLYLGVHYPTDVLGGALLGWLVGWFVRGRTVWRLAAARSTS